MVKLCLLTLLSVSLSCARLPEQTTDRAQRALPTAWQAQGLKSQWGAQCGKPQAVGLEVWTFCDGEASVHGSLRRYHPQSGVRSAHVIYSRDPLAMAVSVSAQSSWVVGEDAVWVGTQDGRLLKFSFTGDLIGTHEFELHAWVKDLHLVGDQVLALTALHRRVALVSVNFELQLLKSSPVSEAIYQAQLRVSEHRIVVASDRGILREYSPQLTLMHQWDLVPGVELSAPLVSSQAIWVGDERGAVHHVTATERKSRTLAAGSSISSAPIAVGHGVWVAFDEEGLLRLIDENLKAIRVVAIPFQRTLLEVQAFQFDQHRLLEVTSNGVVSLVDGEGNILLSQEAPGEFTWDIRPSPVAETLMSERLPASVGN